MNTHTHTHTLFLPSLFLCLYTRSSQIEEALHSVVLHLRPLGADSQLLEHRGQWSSLDQRGQWSSSWTSVTPIYPHTDPHERRTRVTLIHWRRIAIRIF